MVFKSCCAFFLRFNEAHPTRRRIKAAKIHKLSILVENRDSTFLFGHLLLRALVTSYSPSICRFSSTVMEQLDYLHPQKPRMTMRVDSLPRTQRASLSSTMPKTSTLSTLSCMNGHYGSLNRQAERCVHSPTSKIVY